MVSLISATGSSPKRPCDSRTPLPFWLERNTKTSYPQAERRATQVETPLVVNGDPLSTPQRSCQDPGFASISLMRHAFRFARTLDKFRHILDKLNH
jgi:hypothetical protein